MQGMVKVVADMSGSIEEMGKVFLIRNLLRYISQLALIHEKDYSNVSFKYFGWNSEISELIVQVNEDFPYIEPEGQTNLGQLKAFIENSIDCDESIKTLLLSDGYYSKTDLNDFVDWSKHQRNVAVAVVSIGADADDLCLKKLSTNGKVYKPEETSIAIDLLLRGLNAQIRAPETIADINVRKTESVEFWNE